MNNSDPQDTLAALLASRLSDQASAFLEASYAEIAAGVSDSRFSQLIALASRHARRTPLSSSAEERERANTALPGWDPADWNLLESLRIALILARPDLKENSFAQAFENAFQYADEGELCTFYRAIALLPEGQRFVWRAGEGCRTNMTSVFRAVACDNPYPVSYFDDIAWQQLVMKALFVGVPLWRVYGLDQRLSDTLAVMMLDYADERTSAGRDLPPDAWLLLGQHWSARAAQAVERALAGNNPIERCAAVLALGRAGQQQRLLQLQTDENDPLLLANVQRALTDKVDAVTYQRLLTESDDYAVF